MSRLQEVKEELQQLRLEERRLEAENFHGDLKERLPAVIGHTFVFRNSSSGGHERWNTFRKLKSIKGNNSLRSSRAGGEL